MFILLDVPPLINTQFIQSTFSGEGGHFLSRFRLLLMWKRHVQSLKMALVENGVHSGAFLKPPFHFHLFYIEQTITHKTRFELSLNPKNVVIQPIFNPTSTVYTHTHTRVVATHKTHHHLVAWHGNYSVSNASSITMLARPNKPVRFPSSSPLKQVCALLAICSHDGSGCARCLNAGAYL